MSGKLRSNSLFLKATIIAPFFLSQLNPWIYLIFIADRWLFITVIIFSVFLFAYALGRLNKLLLFFVFIFFVTYQYSASSIEDFSQFSENERTVQILRLNEYPLNYSILGINYYLPLAHWLEQRSESIYFYRLKNKAFNVLDGNYYFFASHPRETVGVSNFERLPFILLPFLLAGFYLLKFDRRNIFFVLLLISIIEAVFLKYPDKTGFTLIYPFITVGIAVGLKAFLNSLQRLKKYE
jgi:hypothetical protein